MIWLRTIGAVTAAIVNQRNTPNPYVNFQATNSNFCTEIFLSVSGDTSSPELIQQFTVAHDDSSAALKATIPVRVCIFSLSGVSWTNHTAIVNVSWTVTAHATRQ